MSAILTIFTLLNLLLIHSLIFLRVTKMMNDRAEVMWLNIFYYSPCENALQELSEQYAFREHSRLRGYAPEALLRRKMAGGWKTDVKDLAQESNCEFKKNKEIALSNELDKFINQRGGLPCPTPYTHLLWKDFRHHRPPTTNKSNTSHYRSVYNF